MRLKMSAARMAAIFSRGVYELNHDDVSSVAFSGTNLREIRIKINFPSQNEFEEISYAKRRSFFPSLNMLNRD